MINDHVDEFLQTHTSYLSSHHIGPNAMHRFNKDTDDIKSADHDENEFLNKETVEIEQQDLIVVLAMH